MEDDCDEYLCGECKEYFPPSDFDSVDDEFDEENPMCVDCQAEVRISQETCDHCGKPAEYEVADFFLCEDHYEHYVDGYSSD